MAEVRDIALSETPPQDADWVLVEQTPGGKFTANGSAAHRTGATFFNPSSFDTEIAALDAALSWANENDVPVVYVRGRSRS